MNGVVRQHQEERPVPVRFDELERHVSQPVGEVGILRVTDKIGNVRDRPVRIFVRREVRAGLACLVDREGEIKPLRIRQKALPAEVPLSDVARRESVVTKRFADRNLCMRELADIVGLNQQPVLLAADPIREIQPGRVPAGHQAGSGRRADGARRVELGEPRSTGSQIIDVRCLVEAAPVHPRIRPAQVIDDDQHDVGRKLWLGRRTGEQCECEAEPGSTAKRLH